MGLERWASGSLPFRCAVVVCLFLSAFRVGQLYAKESSPASAADFSVRFRIEGAPDEVRAKSITDIDQMDEMIAAALSFVRDATQPGDRTQLELASLLEEGWRIQAPKKLVRATGRG